MLFSLCFLVAGALLVSGDFIARNNLLDQEKSLAATAGVGGAWSLRDKKQTGPGSNSAALTATLSGSNAQGSGVRYQPPQPQQPFAYPAYPAAFQGYPQPSSPQPAFPYPQQGYTYAPVGQPGLPISFTQGYPGPSVGYPASASSPGAGYPAPAPAPGPGAGYPAAGPPPGYALVAIQGPQSPAVPVYPNQSPVPVNLVPYPSGPFVPSQPQPQPQQQQLPVYGPSFPPAAPAPSPQPAFPAPARFMAAPQRQPAYQGAVNQNPFGPQQQQQPQPYPVQPQPAAAPAPAPMQVSRGYTGYVYPSPAQPLQASASFQPSSFGAAAGGQQSMIPINIPSGRERPARRRRGAESVCEALLLP